MSLNSIVIAGAGQGGFQMAASLRQDGYEGDIALIGEEPGLPYQRPPLSKAYLKEGHAERLLFRNADFYPANRIRLVEGRVAAIERHERRVVLEDGGTHPYEHLVLAIGARNRRLPLPGIGLDRVLELRTLAHADTVRAAIGAGRRIVVIGGGFIGLETAATASAAGATVTVLEATQRLMSRVVSPPVSEHFLAMHREIGTQVRLEALAHRIVDDGSGGVGAVELADGTSIEADYVLVAAGVVPNSEIAEQAGLYVHDGIRVDDLLSTEDPAISAIGDCASFPFGQDGLQLRLESVQNAIDQAKCVARRLLGHPERYAKVPWFWSDQGPHKLQMAGLTAGADEQVVQKSSDGKKIAVHCFRRGELVGVETIDSPGEHMAARKLLGLGKPVTVERARSADFDLGKLLREG